MGSAGKEDKEDRCESKVSDKHMCAPNSRENSSVRVRGRGRRAVAVGTIRGDGSMRSEEHTYELQSLMRITYDDFCLKINKHKQQILQLRNKTDSRTSQY